MSKLEKILTLKNGFYLIGILNIIDIIQTIPFFPRFEANPYLVQHPYTLFAYKVVLFVIIVPLVLPKLMEKYSTGSDPASKILRFLLYFLAVVGNVIFFYVVISNTIAILGILNTP